MTHDLARRGLNPLAFTGGLGNGGGRVSSEDRKPFWLYPNLLSLDAPLVALAWLHVFSKTWRLGIHPAFAYVTLGLVVWSIYVVDRLLDASILSSQPERLEPRHRFHQKYRRWLIAGVVVAMLVAIFLLVTELPMTIFRYLLIGTVMILAFFGLSMMSGQDHEEVALSKNIFAGITFAFGTALTAHVYRWEFGVYELLVSREFICFAVLCVLNIAAIDFWEHAGRSEDEEVKSSDELSLMLPLIVLGFSSLYFAIQDPATRPFHYAILTGVALLYMLNRRRSQFSMDALRVMADLTLLVPVLVFHASFTDVVY